MNRPVWQRRLILLAKLALAVGLLAWLALSGRLQFGRLATISLDWRFAALMALVVASMVIPAFRWWWLLRIQGLPQPVGRILMMTWAGYLAALLLPGAASGDLAKSYLILHRSQARARAFSTVLLDRLLGFQSLFCLGAVSVAWIAWQGSAVAATRAMAVAILLPLAAMTLGLATLLWRPTRGILFRVLPKRWHDAWDESFALYWSGLPQVFGCFGLSLLSSLMTICSLVVAGKVLGEAVAWDATFLAGPLIVVANCLPITPGGIGFAEAASSELFTRLGSAGGAEIMLLTRICTAVATLPGLLVLFGSANSRRDTAAEAPSGPITAEIRDHVPRGG